MGSEMCIRDRSERPPLSSFLSTSHSQLPVSVVQYLRKVIIPAAQYLKDTIPKIQDREPAAFRSQNPAGLTAVLLNILRSDSELQTLLFDLKKRSVF